MQMTELNVKIDISENARYIDKMSVLGVATDDGSYAYNVYLEPKIKRRITNYSSKIDKIHSILVYNLIKDRIVNYSSIIICNDISKNKLKNNLRKLFKDNKYWNELDRTKKITIRAVKNSYVDAYVKKVRKGNERKGFRLTLKRLKKQLELLDKKNKSRHQ